jgi:hypothetical protein
MSRDLVIAAKTMEKHIENILLKLGVLSRAQAIALALQQDPTTNQVLEAASLEPAPRPINRSGTSRG